MNRSSSIDWDAFDRDFARRASKAGFSMVSPTGAPFHAWHRAGRGRAIYLSAGIHGDEPAGPLAAIAMLDQAWFADSDADWTICPALNPYGLRHNLRENADGIDLNRDYQNRISREVSSHASWLLNRKIPDLFISLHEDWETSGFYFYEINLHADAPLRARTILRETSRHLPVEPGHVIDGHDVRECGWIHHAAEADLPESWPEAIFLAKHGCPLSFTFETPSQAGIDLRILAHLAAIRAAHDA